MSAAQNEPHDNDPLAAALAAADAPGGGAGGGAGGAAPPRELPNG